MLVPFKLLNTQYYKCEWWFCVCNTISFLQTISVFLFFRATGWVRSIEYNFFFLCIFLWESLQMRELHWFREIENMLSQISATKNRNAFIAFEKSAIIFFSKNDDFFPFPVIIYIDDFAVYSKMENVCLCTQSVMNDALDIKTEMMLPKAKSAFTDEHTRTNTFVLFHLKKFFFVYIRSTIIQCVQLKSHTIYLIFRYFAQNTKRTHFLFNFFCSIHSFYYDFFLFLRCSQYILQLLIMEPCIRNNI